MIDSVVRQMPQAIQVCFWCGHPRNEDMALTLGRHVFDGYDPCNRCKGEFDKGILLIEVVGVPVNGRPALGRFWPTGRWMVTSAKTIRQHFAGVIDPETVAEVEFLKRAFIAETAWRNLGLPQRGYVA